MNIVRILQNTKKSNLIMGGVVLLCMVGFLDYFTGNELSFSFFYLIPIAILSWATKTKIGIAISFLSAGVWLIADVLSGAQCSSPVIFFWNTMIRFGFFLLMVFLIRVGKALEFEKEISRTDFLTGAVNSRFFNELMQMEIDRSKRYQHPLTVAFIDVDDFKAVNDQFGHLMGDKVLETVAMAMRDCLRKTDIVARVGGDEFAILLPETGADVAQTVIPNMQCELLNEMSVNHWRVTFSMGVVTFIFPPNSADEAMNMSDELMYSVKNSGKNNISYMTYPS